MASAGRSRQLTQPSAHSAETTMELGSAQSNLDLARHAAARGLDADDPVRFAFSVHLCDTLHL